MNQLIVTLLNGFTVAAIYFIVSSGFSLIFGVMKVVNMAHGSVFLAGGYVAWTVADRTGYWALGVLAGTLAMALLGPVVQQLLLRPLGGDDLRETLVTIGLSVVAADLMLAFWGGLTYNFRLPSMIAGTFDVPGLEAKFPQFALFVVVTALVLGAALWALLFHTSVGHVVRAGIDDQEMIKALGFNVQILFAGMFALGFALAALGGVLGGSLYSIHAGIDMNYLVVALLVVIVGGMGSLTGTALGAVVIGLASEFGLSYFPAYSQVLLFGLVALMLAFKPRGLMGASL